MLSTSNHPLILMNRLLRILTLTLLIFPTELTAEKDFSCLLDNKNYQLISSDSQLNRLFRVTHPNTPFWYEIHLFVKKMQKMLSYGFCKRVSDLFPQLETYLLMV